MTYHEEATQYLDVEPSIYEAVMQDHNAVVVPDHNALVLRGQNRFQIVGQNSWDTRRLCDYLERRDFWCYLNWQYFWSVKLKYNWHYGGLIQCWINRRYEFNKEIQDQVYRDGPSQLSLREVMYSLNFEMQFYFQSYFKWQWFCCTRWEIYQHCRQNSCCLKMNFHFNMRTYFCVYVTGQKQIYTFKFTLHFTFNFMCLIYIYIPLSNSICSNTKINFNCDTNMYYWGYIKMNFCFSRRRKKWVCFGFRIKTTENFLIF